MLHVWKLVDAYGDGGVRLELHEKTTGAWLVYSCFSFFLLFLLAFSLRDARVLWRHTRVFFVFCALLVLRGGCMRVCSVQDTRIFSAHSLCLVRCLGAYHARGELRACGV